MDVKLEGEREEGLEGEKIYICGGREWAEDGANGLESVATFITKKMG